MSKLANRQAFPHSIQTANGRITDIEGGITIRQYMATQFMAAHLEDKGVTEAAKYAVRSADALIAELEKGGDQ